MSLPEDDRGGPPGGGGIGLPEMLVGGLGGLDEPGLGAGDVAGGAPPG